MPKTKRNLVLTTIGNNGMNIPDYSIIRANQIPDEDKCIANIRFSMPQIWYNKAISLANRRSTNKGEIFRQHTLNNLSERRIRSLWNMNKNSNKGVNNVGTKVEVASTLVSLTLEDANELTDICNRIGITRSQALSCIFSYVDIPENIQIKNTSRSFEDLSLDISDDLNQLLINHAIALNIGISTLIFNIMFDLALPLSSKYNMYLTRNEVNNLKLRVNRRMYLGNYTYQKEAKYKIIKFFSDKDFKTYDTRVKIPSKWKEYIIRNHEAFNKHIVSAFCNDNIGLFKDATTTFNFNSNDTEDLNVRVELPIKEYNRTLKQTNKTFNELIIHIIYQFMGNQEVDCNSFKKANRK